MIDTVAVSEQSPIEKFVEVYQAVGKDNLETLGSIYSEDILFEDPAHRIEGYDNLARYFGNLYENMLECRFDVHTYAVNGDVAFLNWTMTFAHQKLSNGATRKMEGSTMLTFRNGMVVRHKDYFDLGCMIYETVPVMGSVIRYIKKRMAE
ncbi:nuclear transport factor 2 family protein [Veronia pacifica]|uniref:Transcriptional regulator n=1 Tax=Veronia pacifica TaxID=1080227 RepID=A0A1C3EMW4_9GAMM|nr:nuclear transport factor 2 family protein [Veronia pacifica]ODA34571.1 transcriptional regulator [Veronia pacifica]